MESHPIQYLKAWVSCKKSVLHTACTVREIENRNKRNEVAHCPKSNAKLGMESPVWKISDKRSTLAL